MPEPRADWHTLAPDDALGALGSGPDGLSPQEAGRRLEAHGWNVLPRGPVEGPLALLWRQVNNPLIWVLLGSAALAFVMKKTIDGAVVLGVVVLNALIGFVQEWKAGKALAALEQMVPDLTTVVRGGARLTVPAAELVPGDLVALASGDKVPADLRLVAVRNLQVNESALTGESVPVAKDTVPLPLETELGDRRNMAFSGTLVAAGTAQGAVAGTGAATELGRISALLAQTKEVETPLTQALDKVGSALTVAIVAVSAAIFGLALWRGYPLIDATLAAITLAVAAIPEGLPAIITITLAIGVQRMASRKAVVRKLPAVETLGSTTVICSDKTGTLTRNEMTVTRLLAASGLYELTGVGYAPAGRLKRDGRGVDRAPEDVVELLEAAVLVSDAVLRRERESWLLEGDPTEGALVAAAGKVGVDPQGLRARCPRRDAIPFESENLYMASEHDVPGAPSPVVYLKGAPEVVLARCEARRGGAPLLAEEALGVAEDLARDGMRVLAVASKPGTPEEAPLAPADVAGGFTFLGLLAMIDPPRQEAVDAVATCHRAGVTVKMITGDHRATAAAIGRQLGILQEDGAVTGAHLSAMSDAELADAASRVNVFARVAPEHKLKLVRALQAKGEVVAMTGDGVNDAPALKQANIGVAMGITGTAVSKEAADLVLTDDDFASIEAAVEEGRRIWDNLVKSLAFVLPTNIGEALLILVAVAVFPIHDGQPLLPVLPVQILWINLVATVTLALPLAFEAKEPDVMTRPPRQPGTPIMGPFVWFRTVLVAVLMAVAGIALFVQEYARGTASGLPASQALREAQTMTVTSVACLQIFYLLTCRSLKGSVLRIGLFSNATVWVGIVALLLLQAAFVYLPAFHTLFGSAPLDAVEWLKSALAGAVVLPVVLVEKWVRRWLERRG